MSGARVARPGLCAHTCPCRALFQQAVSPDPKLIMKEETGHYWGVGKTRPVLKGLSGDSGNLPATLTMIHGQQRPEHVMEAAAAVSGSNDF